MWRQGDVFIERVAAIPADVKANRLPHGILVHGEFTGHSHQLRDPKSGTLFAGSRDLFLDVGPGGTVIVHEEHGDIALGRGSYRVWRQREYTPQAIVTVTD